MGYYNELKPMPIKERIKADLKEAMKNKNEIEVSVLRMLISAFSNEEIAKGKKDIGISDEEAMEVLNREVKKNRDSISQYEKAGRTELADKEKKEAGVIMKYMPEQMSESEIEEAAREAIKEANAKTEKDFGAVMKILSPKTKGKADGKLVSEIVKKILS